MNVYVDYKDEAAVAFGIALRDKINWIAEKCFNDVVANKLREINEILVVAQRFGTTKVAPLNEGTVKVLIGELQDLKTMGMTKAAKRHLERVLISNGVDEKYLQETMSGAVEM
ncbi:MAG: hypothetical protein Q8R08_01865 [bacterium]|nr:hypothetical protein [bacterium]